MTTVSQLSRAWRVCLCAFLVSGSAYAENPLITAQPLSLTAVPGGGGLMSVTVSNATQVSYQWRHNGNNLVGRTDRELELENIDAAQLGDYDVVVTNATGSTVSSLATVTHSGAANSWIGSANFNSPRFSRDAAPGRVTKGANGKLYVARSASLRVDGRNHSQRGVVMRLNADGSLDTNFFIGSELEDAWAIIEQPNGQVLIGGNTQDEGQSLGLTQFRVFRFNANGQRDESYKSPSFAGIPRFFTLQADGKLLAIPSSTNNGNGGITTMARLNTDGSLDTSFTQPVLSAGGFFFAPAELDSAGRIYVAGAGITTINGISRPNFARLLANGQVDTTYVPTGFTASQFRGIVIQKQGANAGKILLAGGTTQVPGSAAPTANRPLIRLNLDGTVDSSFTLITQADIGMTVRPRLMNLLPDDSVSLVGSTVARIDANGAISATYARPIFSAEAFWMETLDDGSVLVPVEYATTVTTAAGAMVASTLLKFTPTGALDTTFSPGSYQLESYPSNAAVLADGKLLVWGNFYNTNAATRAGAARFNPDGSLDSSYAITGISNLLGITLGNVSSDGRLLASVSIGNPTFPSSSIARFTAAGALDATFTLDASISSATGLRVYQLPDGRSLAWASGAQRLISGTTIFKRLSENGTIDPTFAGLAGSNFGTVFRNSEGAITQVVLGSFSIVGHYPDGRLLAISSIGPYTENPSTLNMTLLRLQADGSVDTTFNAPQMPTVSSFGFTPNITDPQTNGGALIQVSQVQAGGSPFTGVTPLADGSVLVYGNFTRLSGQATPGLAKLTNTGVLDTTFTVGSGAEVRVLPGRSAQVESVTLAADGKIWVTGLFDSFGGRGSIGLARLNANGSVDSSFASTAGLFLHSPSGSQLVFASPTSAYLFGNYETSRGGDFPKAITKLQLQDRALIASQPQNLTITSGGDATLSVSATSSSSLSYQWRRNGVNIPGATNASFTITGAKRTDADRYDVAVTDGSGTVYSRTAVLSVAPAKYPGQLAYDPTFAPNLLSISTRILTALPVENGKWLVGGEFTQWNNTPRSFLARLNADYSLDTTFTPPAIDNFVHALARATDGTIYVGGEFTTVNGHAYPGLFRFSPNGSLDLSWSPRDNPPLAAVTALAIAADGKLLVGRQNTFSGGQVSLTGTNVLRRLNADGTHDTSFSVDITTNNNRLYAIVAEPSGSVAFSGLFSAVNGVTRHSIARVSNTGASDPLFGGSSGAPANNTVFGLTRLADGRYLVAGTFTTLGGVTRNRVALLNLDGTVDPNFAPVALNGNALGAAMNAAGEIFVGGTFNTAEGTASYGLVKLSNTGAVLTRYTDGGVVSSFATTTASRPLFIYPQADGSIALFGSFQAAFNQRRVGLAVVGANGALASSPSALLYRPAFTGSAFEVNGNRTLVFGSIDSAAGAAGQLGQSILLHDNGSIDPAFPAGSGFALNGLSTFGIYRAMRQSDGKFIAVGDLAGYNGNAGNRLLRVGADGAFDAGFNAGTGPSLVFPQILSISGGRTLLFSNATNLSYNGTSFSGMVRLNADGTRDTTFVTRTFVPASSGWLAAYEDNQGRYVVVGTFTSYDGVGAPGIMRLNPDGSRDHSFSVGNVSGGIITVISGLPDGRLIAAGSFTSFNGVSVNRLVLLQEDGQLAPNFSADSAINAPVGQVLVQEDGKLILIGDFTGTPSNYAARLNPSGSLDSSFALHGLTGGGGGGIRVFVAEDGSVYAHNMLASFNNGVPVAVARFRGVATAPSIAVAPQGGALEEGKPSAMFVQAAGTGPFTYQWRLNGNAIGGATNSILRFPGPTSADSGSYSVAITGPGGVTLSNPVTVTVGTLPVITDQPFGRTTVAGGKVLFRATASGTPTLTYQWRKNGVPIVGATNSDLTLSPVSAADAGSYSVAVTNAIGVTLSTAVSLQVIAPDNVLWQQFTETSTEFSPARSFHDGLGKVYLPWSIQDRNPDMGAGKLVGALARYSESTGVYDPTFKLDRRYRSVSHMERQADGKLILAVGAGDAHTVIRVDSTGAVDSTFVAPQFMRSIRFVSLQADGRVLVAATDNLRANTVPDALATGSPAIYRLNANGSIDTSFNVTLLSATGVLFGPPRTDASGRIYLVGSFASVNGVTRANVARLNFDGSLEPNFGANLPTGFGSNQARGVEFQNDGRVIVVGDFRYTARGTSGDPIQAIRFNTDGTFDTTFAQPLRSQLGFNPALGTRARYLVPVGNDKMVVVSDRLVRLNADGTRDTSFTSPAFERESFWLSKDSSGNLYVADQSGVMGAAGLFLPIWDNGVVRFDSNGQPTFAFQTGGFGRAAYPTSARVTSDGNVWLGGSFNRFGASVAPGLARFSSPTTLAANQPAAPSGSPDNFRNSPVTSVTSGGGDLTYVISVLGTNSTGTFYSALQRLNSAGGVDSSFNPVLPSGYNLGTAAPRSGPAGKLMLAQGTVAAAVALNGGAGDSLLRLNVDGTRDSSYIPDLASFAVVERNPVTNAVTMIRTGGLNVAHVNTDGSALLVVSSVDGNLRLVRLLTNGAVDGSFNAPSFGSITPSSGFTSVGTFDPVTNTTGQFPISTYSASDLIRTAVQMPNGKIYVGGRFNLSGSPRGLIRLNADGSLDSSFVGVGIATSAVDAGPYVASLAVDTSGRLHVAGRFTSYNGLSTNGLFRLRADGSFDAAWNPGFGVLDRPLASANLIVAADKLYVFGTGGLTNDALPSAYKFVDIPTAPVFNVQPAVYTGALLEGSTMFVSGTATGPGTLTYQWFRDGVSIPGATNSSYSALAAAGSYTLVVTSEYGSQTSSPAIITITPTSPVFNAAGNNISGTFGQVVPVGTAALLTATPTAGTTPISYQWLFNGVEIPGATSQTYFLSSWSASDAGDYSVRATNSLGTSTSPSDRFLVSHEGGLKWANPMPTGNGLTRGEFLNGQFFVGGLRGTLLVSSDGLNWVQRHVPASNNIFKVQRIGALYVAMASLNAFFTSPDGITWTPRSTGVDGGLTSFQDMTAGGGRIVAVGTGGVTGVSTDGVNWTIGSIGSGLTDTLFGATYVLNKYYAVSSTTGRVYSSPDGLAWTSVATPATTLRNLTYGAGRLVAVGSNGVIVTSSDGTAWSSVNSGVTAQFLGVNYVNNLFVATGVNGTILTSVDGLTWMQRSSNGNLSNLQNATYGNGRYVIVGQGGTHGRIILTSVDGVTWSNGIFGPREGTNLFNVATDGTIVVAAGAFGAIIISTNGVTWTDRSSGTSQTLNDLAYAAGKFVAVGNAGVVTSSLDGTTWSVQTTTGLSTSALWGIRHDGTQWIVVGAGGLLATSPNGTTWTSRVSSTTATIVAVANGGGKYVAVTSSGTLISSADGITWTGVTAPGTAAFTDVTYGNGVFVALGNTGRVVRSSDGTNWAASAFTNTNFRSVRVIGGHFVATSTNSTYYTSENGETWTGRYTGVFDTVHDTVRFGNSVVAVGNFGNIITGGAPEIVTPGAQTVSGGAAAAIKFTVSNSPLPVTYQWFKDGNAITGPNAPILVIPSASANDAGNYSITATNALGSTQSGTTNLALTIGVVITDPPKPQTALVGGAARFTVGATGTPAPSYQWFLRGVPIGTNADSLSISNLRLSDDGLVTVRVFNASGSITSSPVQLTVNPIAPVITSPLAIVAVANVPFSYQIGTNQTVASFDISALPSGLTLDPVSGILSGRPTVEGVHNLTLTATNVSGSDQKTLQLTVQAPPPVITSSASGDGRVGVPFSYTITATNSPTSFSAFNLPPGLTISGAVISGSPTTTGFYQSSVAAQSSTGINSRALSIQILGPLNAPVFSGPNSVNGTAGTAFSYTPNYGSGNTGYALVNLANGSASVLPTGLTLNTSTGTISGTTSQQGSFTIALRATNADGSTTTTLTLSINPALTAPLFTSSSSPVATVGVPFSFTLTTNPAATNFTAPGLPNGLTLAPSTGVISGTPTEPGVTQTIVTAANAGGSSSNSLTIVVNSSPNAPVLTSSPVAVGRAGNPLSFQLTGSNTPTLFAVMSGALPAGLTLNASSGLIEGTPVASGSARVWLSASNAAGGRGPAMEMLFTIERALTVPVVTSNGSATARVGTPFNYQILATNSPTSFAATPIPEGLTFDATAGTITGIPSAASSQPVSILLSASNGDGTSAPKLLSLTIQAPPATPQITSSGTAGGRVGVAFSYQITASENPNSFAVDSLPDGLALNSSTGLITGQATAAGQFTIQIKAANAAGLGQAFGLTLNFAPPLTAPAITSPASANAKVGTLFSYAIVASGTPTGFVLNGVLPAGLTFNSSTGVIQGNPSDSPGLFLVTLGAFNASGSSQPQNLTINLAPADNVPVITSAQSAIATVGVAFTYQITATNVPSETPFPPSVFLDAVGLPPGLAVNPSTGLIQGEPTIAGIYECSLVGINANGTGRPRALTITVSPAPHAPTITSASAVSAQAGTVFSYQIAATNSPTSFEALEAPSWLNVNTATGVLAGTPSGPGEVILWISAVNAGGASNTMQVTITVAAAPNTPVITSSHMATVRIGDPFNYQVMATRTPTSYQASGLPPGLSINSATGLISGNATTSGTFEIRVSATNANGEGQSVIRTLTVLPSLQING